jgi:hypothetical protein
MYIVFATVCNYFVAFTQNYDVWSSFPSTMQVNTWYMLVNCIKCYELLVSADFGYRLHSINPSKSKVFLGFKPVGGQILFSKLNDHPD